jgi:hypothetical protein
MGGSQGGGYENTFFWYETSYNLLDMYCVVKKPATYFTLAEQCISVNGRQGIRHRIPDDNLLVNYLLTPWSTILLEKLTGLQLPKKFPAFYGTRSFITAFTSARHLSLS